ncbi:MAG: hypothetical protein IJD13_06310 [Oscillospiraceae bacterium]|nr:hypothetical protein [Oscillospiraceae bacterium]
MKKIIAISLVLIAMLALPAMALETAETATGDLRFSGSSAICGLYVTASPDDEIVASMILMENNRLVARWNDTGTGTLRMNESYPATSGNRYTLIFDVEVDGVSLDLDSQMKTCP